jgi:RNA recognition motif-containing protein
MLSRLFGGPIKTLARKQLAIQPVFGMRFFNDENTGNSNNRGKLGPIDDRVPYFAKNRVRVFDIPDSVTTEQISEKFGKFGEIRSVYEPEVDPDHENPR